MYTVKKILYFIRSRRMILTKESYAGNRKKRFLFYGLMILCAFSVVILQFSDRVNTVREFSKVRFFIRVILYGKSLTAAARQFRFRENIKCQPETP